MNITLFSGIKRLFNKPEGENVVILDAKSAGSFSFKLIVLIAREKAEISYEYHYNSLPASLPEDHAHCRLYPPQSASISSTSPQA